MTGAGQGALAGGVVLAAVGLLALCATRMVAADLAQRDPIAALAWDHANARALSAQAWSLATRRGSAGDRAAAERDARLALRRAPLDVRALDVLALEADSRGQGARVRAMMRLAGARTWGDDLSQLWLFSDALTRRDYAAASLHADAVLRHDPAFGRYLFPVMIRALGDGAALRAIVARLAEAPAWRAGFLSAVAAPPTDAKRARAVFDALAATAAPPTDAERAGLIARLVADQDYGDARAVWAPEGVTGAGKGAGQANPVWPLVWNGDFQTGRGLPPFNWRLYDADGAGADMEAGPGGAAALRVQSPAEHNATLAEQLLVLPPGVYRFTGAGQIEAGPADADPSDGGPADESPSDGGQADAGSGDALFAWQIGCVGAGDATLAGTQIQAGAQGSGGWRTFSFPFLIPAQGCQAQWLRLVGLSHEGFDPANAWFRAIRITPAGGG